MNYQADRLYAQILIISLIDVCSMHIPNFPKALRISLIQAQEALQEKDTLPSDVKNTVCNLLQKFCQELELSYSRKKP